ncbi:MBL fold metallo-hydrolase [Martelella radicis]|uniref:Phosphoribosyl 1,2-cyclic phosphate phosphodiesterase n=1 Tax=Martelella radicis TaxID=1397476 RepID=A0A7W6KFN8_9HYPH|nr:MBL fold metallo-hydrolase [Martelella radicis]MBB4120374.1 phosphoribosyl 1,2-cyclic phosphate phosphodiesterase [Martelella radicis]
MAYRRRFTILGCSSSPGVPRITGDWGACDPENPKNRRTRTAFLVEQFAPDGGVTTVVIDTGPDFREQMIRAGVKRIDAVLFTHAHADHIHGIDDIRGYFHAQRQRIPVYADEATMARILEGFAYCLETPKGSAYPPIARANVIEDFDSPVEIDGPGGRMRFMPHRQQHGDIISLGYRLGNVAYCTDVSDFPTDSIDRLRALDLLVIDALQYHPHPSHLSLGQALSWIERLGARRAILTHMHIPLDYATVAGETPDHVEPAFDGLSVTFDVADDAI